MTNPSTKSLPDATVPGAGTPAAPGEPGAWDAPWERREDAAGWETVYRGRGQRRPVRSVLEVELSPEQRAWIGPAARAAGLTRTEFVHKLIEEARLAAKVAEGAEAAG